VQETAVQALGKLRAAEAMPQIIGLMKNGKGNSRKIAALALERILCSHQKIDVNQENLFNDWQKQHVKEIQEKIFSPVYIKKQESINELGSIFSEQSVNLLQGFLYDENKFLKKASVGSVGMIGEFRPSALSRLNFRVNGF